VKELLKYSKFLHWMTFLCLCLPFFYTGCEKKTDAPAVEATQQIEVDSTNANLEKVDTVSITSKATNKPQNSVDNVESTTEKKEKTLSETLSQEYTFLQPILVSKEDTFSGLAMLIDCGSYIVFFSIFLYVLLSILSLTIKYLESNGTKIIALLDVLSLFFLAISRPVGLFDNKLWGLWVAIIIFSAVTILDIYILTKYHQNKGKDYA
jgi:hypothetical protein